MISPNPDEANSKSASEALTTELAATLVSRICHDLVSPLGAVGNGLELLAMTHGSQSPEMALINDSMVAANQRIQLFRMAFGLAGAGQRIATADLGGLLGDYGRSGRLAITLDAEGDLARKDAKLVALAVLCLGTALAWGGQVLICRAETRGQAGAASGWRLVAEAERTRSDPRLWSWLDLADSDMGPLPSPGEIHFPLLGFEVLTQGRRITWELDETGAEIAF